MYVYKNISKEVYNSFCFINLSVLTIQYIVRFIVFGKEKFRKNVQYLFEYIYF